MIASAAELADFYGVDRRTVTNWINEDPPCPSRKRKGERVFDTAQVAKWHSDRAARQAIAQHEKAKPPDVDDAKARKLEAEAQLAEITVAEKRGELVPLDVVEQLVGEVCDRMRAVLVNAPSNQLLALERAGVPAAVGQAVLEAMSQDLTRALRGVSEEIEEDDDGGDRPQ